MDLIFLKRRGNDRTGCLKQDENYTASFVSSLNLRITTASTYVKYLHKSQTYVVASSGLKPGQRY